MRHYLISLVALIALAAPSMRAQNIAYFNISRVMSEYEYAADRTASIQKEAAVVEKEISTRKQKLEAQVQDYQRRLSAEIYTQSQAMAEATRLQNTEQSIQTYAQTKQNEIQQKMQAVNHEVLTLIKRYVDKLNAGGRYTLILANQVIGGMEGEMLSLPVVNGSASLDITDQIIAGMNAEYAKLKN